MLFRSIEANLGLGICLLHQEKPEPAAACFDTVLKQQSSHETAKFGKAVALQLLWKFDEASSIYQGILAKNPQSEESLVNLVTIGMARKDYDAIQSNAEKLLQLRPHSQAALEGLATCAFQRNDFEAAATFCKKLTEFTPDHFERWFNLGGRRIRVAVNVSPRELTLHSPAKILMDLTQRHGIDPRR